MTAAATAAAVATTGSPAAGLRGAAPVARLTKAVAVVAAARTRPVTLTPATASPSTAASTTTATTGGASGKSARVGYVTQQKALDTRRRRRSHPAGVPGPVASVSAATACARRLGGAAAVAGRLGRKALCAHRDWAVRLRPYAQARCLRRCMNTKDGVCARALRKRCSVQPYIIVAPWAAPVTRPHVAAATSATSTAIAAAAAAAVITHRSPKAGFI